jgi:hypothetical protein
VKRNRNTIVNLRLLTMLTAGTLETIGTGSPAALQR